MLTLQEIWRLVYSPPFLSLFVLVSAVIYKHTKLGNTGIKGWGWIISGAMIYLLLTVLNTVDLALLSMPTYASQWVPFFFSVVFSIFVIIGVLKIILDLIR